MDTSHSYPAISTIAITFSLPVFFLILLWISKTSFRSTNKKRAAPEAGNSWPVLGHLHLLVGQKPAHLTLSAMADKYGPIFTIKLGVRRALVVSSWETAKECLTTNDKAFATRPKNISMEVLGYNHAMFGFAPYGPYWRNMRKITTLELLANHRLDMLKHVRESEMKVSLQELYQLWKENKNSSDKVLVEMDKWFRDATANVILKMIVGKRISSLGNDAESRRWKEALKEFFELSGKFLVADAFPFLRWLDIGGDERLMKKVKKVLNEVAEEWLQEHKQKRASGEFKVEGEDFMDAMLSILTDAEEYDADTINKATCLNLILAATDPTAVILIWCLALLLNNRDALKKAQQEIDIHIGKDKLVEENDIKNLVYLQAIIKETLRLHPAGPLAVPHESMEDCTVNGYHIPAGTELLINLYKIHRDSRVWSDPYKFQPERFLTTHKKFDVRGQNFELIPFTSGRRMCPGVSFALQVVQLTLANLLHGFDIATPFDEPVDMREAAGLSNFKATPLEVSISPRLPNYCYELK
ncbi:cytochrome P450 CYP82D47-like [Herrania umbratica]|uniref:Cytochrome P450 CYP82D47-like n=1 Tax=Herrania umbratica TaxID=108875 RepID=A0A6J1AE09_9ROSI|nr:cytochrome P450 CYP82D47-like [Herrania umbratica]